MKIDDLTIDAEFRDLLPEASKDEKKNLEKLILKEGFKEKLFAWKENGHAFLIDGHRRLAIWKKHEDDLDPPGIEVIDLPDREAVKVWMLWRQFSRRNATGRAAAILRGRLYKALSKRPKENLVPGGKNSKKHRVSSVNQNDSPSSTDRTSEAVGRSTGVSSATVQRDAAYVDALDAIGAVNAKAKADIESGSLAVGKSDVIAIGKMDREGIARALKNVRMGRDIEDMEIPEGLSPEVAKLVDRGKLQAEPEQLAALAKMDEDTQEELAASVVDGRQTLDRAIETGEVPPPTIEEVMEEKNKEIESFCRSLMKFVEDNMPKDKWLDHENRVNAAVQKFKDGCSTLRTAKCAQRCPKCEDGCKFCKQTGRVPKAVYDTMV